MEAAVVFTRMARHWIYACARRFVSVGNAYSTALGTAAHGCACSLGVVVSAPRAKHETRFVLLIAPRAFSMWRCRDVASWGSALTTRSSRLGSTLAARSGRAGVGSLSGAFFPKALDVNEFLQ